MNKKIIFISIAFLIFIPKIVFAQDYPFDVDQYDFIRYEKNKIQFHGDSSEFENLFAKFDNLILKGTGQIKIVQIGASHTQADIFSAQMRGRLQTFFPGLNAGRGYVFPFRMMRTNNPSNFYTKHTGKWDVCRNVQHITCLLGLTGISATTADSNATVSVFINNKSNIKYYFNSLKIYHSTDSFSYKINIFPDSIFLGQMTYPDLGYTEIFLNDYYEEIHIKLNKTSIWQNTFTLYGISLETQDPGVLYHPIGVNGASTTSFTKCQLFEQQLKVFDPDWVVIVLGTNDGYTSRFDSSVFKANYRHLVMKIKKASPNVAITFVVPNDCYLYRRRPNKATGKQANVLKELSEELGCSVWDMYEIMGGYNSSVLWYKAGLMARDKIHFVHRGYILLGNLFFNAFLRAYDNHIEKLVKKKNEKLKFEY